MRLELPSGCAGLDSPGRKKVYRPKEMGGAVEVNDNPAFARQLVGVGLRALPSKSVGFSSAPGWTCERCGRGNFAWAEKCSGCGGDEALPAA